MSAMSGTARRTTWASIASGSGGASSSRPVRAAKSEPRARRASVPRLTPSTKRSPTALSTASVPAWRSPRPREGLRARQLCPAAPASGTTSSSANTAYLEDNTIPPFDRGCRDHVVGRGAATTSATTRRSAAMSASPRTRSSAARCMWGEQLRRRERDARSTSITIGDNNWIAARDRGDLARHGAERDIPPEAQSEPARAPDPRGLLGIADGSPGVGSAASRRLRRAKWARTHASARVPSSLAVGRLRVFCAFLDAGRDRARRPRGRQVGRPDPRPGDLGAARDLDVGATGRRRQRRDAASACRDHDGTIRLCCAGWQLGMRVRDFLRIDSDEVPSAALVRALPARPSWNRSSRTPGSRAAGCHGRPGQVLDRGRGAPDCQLRLIRNDGGFRRFPGEMHSSVEVHGPRRLLAEPLYHADLLVQDAVPPPREGAALRRERPGVRVAGLPQNLAHYVPELPGRPRAGVRRPRTSGRSRRCSAGTRVALRSDARARSVVTPLDALGRRLGARGPWTRRRAGEVELPGPRPDARRRAS